MKLLIVSLWICLKFCFAGSLSIIGSNRITDWGDWSEFESCSPGTFVIGFRQKVEPEKNGDNTALNDIELICSDNKLLRFQRVFGKLGKWSKQVICLALLSLKTKKSFASTV